MITWFSCGGSELYIVFAFWRAWRWRDEDETFSLAKVPNHIIAKFVGEYVEGRERGQKEEQHFHLNLIQRSSDPETPPPGEV